MIRTEPDMADVDEGVVAWLRNGEIAVDVEPMLLRDHITCGVTITPGRALRLADELLDLLRGEGPEAVSEYDGSHEGVIAWMHEGKPSIDVKTAYVVWVGIDLTWERVITLAADLRELVEAVPCTP